jgi:surfeit locus 1 family protein
METALSPWSPRLWGAHAVLLVVLAGTVMLGYWQWHVSRDHRADQVASLAHETPRPLTDVLGHDASLQATDQGRPVTITGTWVDSGTLFVQQDAGGYWVITPIAVGAATDPAIYVVRGSTTTRTAPPVSGSTTVVGWLEPDWQDSSPVPAGLPADVLPRLQLSLAAPHVHQDLFGAYAVVADQEGSWQVATSNDGTAALTSVPSPAAPKPDATTGLRNLLYAIEWWLFGCLAVYIWWRWIQEQLHPELRGRGQGGTASETAQDDAVPSKP